MVKLKALVLLADVCLDDTLASDAVWSLRAFVPLSETAEPVLIDAVTYPFQSDDIVADWLVPPLPRSQYT